MMKFDDIASTHRSPRKYLTKFVLLFSVVSLGMLLFGCGSGSTSNTARVRSLNTYVPASGTDGSLTITSSNGTPLNGAGTLGFGMFANSGAYTSVSSGNVTILASGTGLTSPLTLTSSLNGDDAAYTLVAAGQAGQTNALVPQLLAIPNFTANQIVIPSGDAAIRVVNVSLNPNPVGLYNTVNNVPTTVVSSTPGSVAYGYGAANLYVAVPTTQLTNLALVDSTKPQTALALSTASNLNSNTFVSGQAYTLYVYGQPGNTTQPLSATWVEDFP